LNAECREKIWTVAGPEFGSDEGTVMLITRALYGLKSSGAAWRAKLAETLQDLYFRSTKADPDMWLREAKTEDGREYYEMVMVYVDDVCVMGESPGETMDAIGDVYKIKPGSRGKPSRYLGADISEYELGDGTPCWSLSADEYVANAIKNLETMLQAEGVKLRTKAYRPMSSNYRPEVDVSAELNASMTHRYQNLIGVLRWAIELGRMDIVLGITSRVVFGFFRELVHLRTQSCVVLVHIGHIQVFRQGIPWRFRYVSIIPGCRVSNGAIMGTRHG